MYTMQNSHFIFFFNVMWKMPTLVKNELYDKRDDNIFSIVNFPFICNNIPTAPAYRVYIS
jgi:hypothetical protein